MTLREYRAAKGLTIRTVAAAIKVSPASVSRYESGEQWPSHKVAQRISKFTKGEVEVTPRDFMRRTKTKRKA